MQIIVQGITQEEQSAVRNKMEEISGKLAFHEGKKHWIAGNFVGFYYPIRFRNRKFIVAPTRVFKEVISNVLPNATQKYPDHFGKYSAEKVLKALELTEPVIAEDFAQFMKEEKFAYIFEVKNNEVIGDILRVDLYRKVERNIKNPERDGFTGGIFHAFKHFSYNGTPLSTHPSQNNIPNPSDFINTIVEAFFISPKVPKVHKRFKKAGFETITLYKGKYNLEAMFYYEQVSGTYFISRIGIR